MKNSVFYFVLFNLLISLSVFARHTERLVFENKNNCKIEVTQLGSEYNVVFASKRMADGDYKSASVMFSNDLTDGEITTYCSDHNKENTKITACNESVFIECLNGKAAAKITFDANHNISSFDFTGKHSYLFMTVDDSFLCHNLQIKDTNS